MLEAVTSVLRDPVSLLTDAGQRAYWPFLITSLVIALAVGLRRTGPVRRALAPALSRRIWLHRSALMDYRLLFVRALVRVVLLAPLMLSALTVAVWTVGGLTGLLGAPAPSSMSPAAIAALYTVVLFVAWDFSRYLVHRLLHTVPVLWQFHQVHHSAEVLTPFTVYRVHPVESALSWLRTAVVTGVVTGAFFYAFGDRAVQYELLGVNAIALLFNGLGANLRHSHVWLSYGRVLERVFISPAQHQIHHSRDPRDHGTNYGSCLAIWDWLAGSLRLAGPRREIPFGLDARDSNHDPTRVTSAVAMPLAAIARRLLSQEDDHEPTTVRTVELHRDRGLHRG